MAPLLGMNDINTDAMSAKLEETLSIIKKVNAQFKNPVIILKSPMKVMSKK